VSFGGIGLEELVGFGFRNRLNRGLPCLVVLGEQIVKKA
jgi:hypothetical protein